MVQGGGGFTKVDSLRNSKENPNSKPRARSCLAPMPHRAFAWTKCRLGVLWTCFVWPSLGQYKHFRGPSGILGTLTWEKQRPLGSMSNRHTRHRLVQSSQCTYQPAKSAVTLQPMPVSKKTRLVRVAVLFWPIWLDHSLSAQCAIRAT